MRGAGEYGPRAGSVGDELHHGAVSEGVEDVRDVAEHRLVLGGVRLVEVEDDLGVAPEGVPAKVFAFRSCSSDEELRAPSKAVLQP